MQKMSRHVNTEENSSIKIGGKPLESVAKREYLEMAVTVGNCILEETMLAAEKVESQSHGYETWSVTLRENVE
jgi:hypothetical protein